MFFRGYVENFIFQNIVDSYFDVYNWKYIYYHIDDIAYFQILFCPPQKFVLTAHFHYFNTTVHKIADHNGHAV